MDHKFRNKKKNKKRRKINKETRIERETRQRKDGGIEGDSKSKVKG